MVAIEDNISTAARIENILGPKTDRYCSNGFRNVRFSFADISNTSTVKRSKKFRSRDKDIALRMRNIEAKFNMTHQIQC
jgi:hypothetical protein